MLALRLSGLGWSAFSRVSPSRTGSRLLAGSMWLFVVGVGLPIGSQTGRVLLAHLSTPAELSRYALMAQMYAICWQVLSTAALAYWPIFVKRREATEVTVRMWWRLTGTFAAVGVIAALCLVSLGPWAASVLSGGKSTYRPGSHWDSVSCWWGSPRTYPAMVLLTRPNEAAMASTVGAGDGRDQYRSRMCGGIRFGAVGVVYASALAIFAAQVLPDLVWVPRLVRRRPLVAG